MKARLTRRGLLQAGGATAAGAAALGTAALRAREASGQTPLNALLIVLPTLRSSHVNAFDGDSPAKTPNLDDLTHDSLRFDRAIPESMPAVSVRRAILTGMRGYPFRDWRAQPDLPAVPGWTPIYDYQPVLMEAMRPYGIATAYVTDNPLLKGPRFPDVHRTPKAALVALPHTPAPPGIDTDVIPSLGRARDAAVASIGVGINLLTSLKGQQPFFLGVDGFDALDAYEAPRFYARPDEVADEGVGPTDGRLVELDFSGDDLDKVRDRYRKNVEEMDKAVGRLMDRLHDLDLAGNTVVYLLGDHGIALGEHDYLGKAAPTSHRPSYEVPYLIRHPEGHKSGDDIDWYASSHDVAPTLLSFMGLGIPGKMEGEDLTQLFEDVDQWDLHPRPVSITAFGTQVVVRDNRWLMIRDGQQLERRLYDDDEEADDDIKRYDDVANDEPGVLTDLSVAAVVAAGGNLPEFGPEGALRPPRERSDDDTDDDGIPNDFDAVDNDEPDDDDEPSDEKFNGLKAVARCAICGAPLTLRHVMTTLRAADRRTLCSEHLAEAAEQEEAERQAAEGEGAEPEEVDAP
jgi:arylsulfatase A-like enzyme